MARWAMARRLNKIALSEPERQSLTAIVRRGSAPVRQYQRARVLLLADQGLNDTQIIERADVSRATVERIRRRCVQERTQGTVQAITERPRPGRRPIFDPEMRAKVTALACSAPPKGRGRWTLRLLADKAVELGYVESISHETIGVMLKKTTSSRT